VQEQTTQLAQGVGQLAEKSGELSQEIRTNRPVNPNLIFSDFQANRVATKLTARKPGLFSPSIREKEAQTVLVSDGHRTYALMHLSDTPFTLVETPGDYDQVTGTAQPRRVQRAGGRTAVPPTRSARDCRARGRFASPR
jgi:X-X-X-Leu-X-X-Gly heptad repeat protein